MDVSMEHDESLVSCSEVHGVCGLRRDSSSTYAGVMVLSTYLMKTL